MGQVGQLLLDFAAHDGAVFQKVFVVGEDRHEPLEALGVVAGHAGQGLPKAPTGVAFDALAPDHDGEGPEIDPVDPFSPLTIFRDQKLFVLLGRKFEEVAVNPINVGIGLVEGRKGFHVFIGNIADRPGGHEIEQVGLVYPFGSGGGLNQALLFFEAVPQGCVGKGLQHAHHRVGNARATHKFHDAVAGPLLFTVEADDESGHHPQAIACDFVDGIF